MSSRSRASGVLSRRQRAGDHFSVNVRPSPLRHVICSQWNRNRRDNRGSSFSGLLTRTDRVVGDVASPSRLDMHLALIGLRAHWTKAKKTNDYVTTRWRVPRASAAGSDIAPLLAIESSDPWRVRSGALGRLISLGRIIALVYRPYIRRQRKCQAE